VRDAEPRACAGHPSPGLRCHRSEEYFDRRNRDEAHFAAALAYIENNPVAARLCSRAAEWEFSSPTSGAAEKRAGRARPVAPRIEALAARVERS
jgi:hypothetical protein